MAGDPGGHARVVVAHVVLPTPAAHTRQHPPAVLSSISKYYLVLVLSMYVVLSSIVWYYLVLASVI